MEREHGYQNAVWSLPTTERFLKNALREGVVPAGAEIILIQHLLLDSAAFVRLLTALGFQILKVFAIPYSVHEGAVAQVDKIGTDVAFPRFTGFEDAIRETLTAKFEGRVGDPDRPVVIQEVGGYCAAFLDTLKTQFQAHCAGIVEETKQGLWRYQAMSCLGIPVMHIAETPLKRMEATFVGEAIGRAIENVMMELGRSTAGLTIGILGYGDIGSAVAKSLGTRNASVTVYDPNAVAVIEAIAEGFPCPGRKAILSSSTLLVGASGTGSVQRGDLDDLRDGVVLVSGSSRDIEFPVRDIIEKATERIELNQRTSKFTLPDGKSLFLVDDGFPINFKHFSLPNFASDLLFCQIAGCICKILNGGLAPGLQTLSDPEQQAIAEIWLEEYYPSSAASSRGHLECC